MASTETITTAEQLWELPSDARCELVRGELRVMSPSGADHGSVSAAIGALLFAHVRATASGTTFGAETGFLIESEPDTVRAPDAAFVRTERATRTPKFFPGAPDFAAEVASPSDSFKDVEEKALMWLSAGTIAVLVLDPERTTATVYRAGGATAHTGTETLDLSDAVPGWKLQLSEVFS